MRKLLTLCAIGIFSLSQAQMITVKERPSFYLGKRATLDVNLLVQPSLEPRKKPEEDIYSMRKYERASQKTIGIYTQISPEIKYTYALSNKFGLYAKANTFSRYKLDSENSFNVSTGENSWDNEYYEEYGYAKLNGFSYGAGVKWFRNGKAAIGPIGSYFGIGLTRHNYNVTHDGMILATDDPGSNSSWGSSIDIIAIDDWEVNFSYMTMDFEFGSTHQITKDIYYKLGVSSSLNFGLGTLDLNSYSDNQTSEEYLTKNAKESLAYSNLMVLKFGLGFVVH